jgi:formate dehydrogenase major subunit
MTGNCAALQVLADEPGYLQISSADAKQLGIRDQELVWVQSRRGKVMSRAMVTDRVNQGAVYMTYQWWVGACNELTIHHLDPISKTPEYKYCAVKVLRVEDQDGAERYVQEEYSRLKGLMAAAAGA